MRPVDEIIVHCTATVRGRNIDIEAIRRNHIDCRGWTDIGYHYLVGIDGTVSPGRPLHLPGAHCKGHNARSIGIAYVGGLEADGSPADTRTHAQRSALSTLIRELKHRFPIKKVSGHRDYAPKACPCFDASREYSALAVCFAFMASLLLSACSSHKSQSMHSLTTAQCNSSAAVASNLATTARDSVSVLLTFDADSVRIVDITSERTFYGVKFSRQSSMAHHSETAAADSIFIAHNRSSLDSIAANSSSTTSSSGPSQLRSPLCIVVTAILSAALAIPLLRLCRKAQNHNKQGRRA